jgi:serine protease Do
VLALVAAAMTAPLGCKRFTSAGGEGDELPPGAVAVPSASSSSVASASPLPSAFAQASPTIPPVSPSGQAAPMSFAPIAKRVDASVVTIVTTGEESEPGFFGRVRHRETHGLGTGFVVDKDGIILTNNHVVKGADEIDVKLSDERVFPAKVVGADPQTDVAVIRIDQSGFTPLTLGDSDKIEVGDWAVAIGNPYGLEHTVSAGIISAKGRTVDEPADEGQPRSPFERPRDPTGYYNFLQTDASINPGNSGGPLLDLRGDVVGINTAIRGDGAQNIGFAIPINMVKQLLPMLLRDGHVTRSALGVRVISARKVAPEDRAQLKIGDKGVVIRDVVPGGPADKAGLQAGDLIAAFDGEATDREEKLKWLASIAGVGRQVTLRVQREGKPFDLRVTLGLLQDQAAPPQQVPRTR